uniref:NADH dehydrogenase subunit 6 n=1 Tax=Cicadellidae gen. 1 sp. 2 XYW-2023a TaxID=3078490 RepID=A0AB38ZHE8_9HEMI
MKFILFKLACYLTTLSCFVKNPMSMGLLLILYSFLVAFFIGKVMLTSWFCMTLVLMMVGGLLVIFMYISSISSNEKFSFSKFFLFFLFFMLFLYIEEFILDFHCFDSISFFNYFSMDESFFLLKLYDLNCMMLTFFLIIYLIFTMVVVSYIVKHYKGPLRSLNYE